MSEIDQDLQRRLKQLADEVRPDAARERVVLDRSRVKRRLVALTSGLMSLLLVGGIAGTSLLWDPDGDPVPPAHSDCRGSAYDVAVFPHDSTTTDELEVMRQALLADRDVEAATFVSKAAAFEEFKEHYADQPEFWENLPEDALPASFRVTLVDGADAGEAAKRFAKLAKVNDVRTAGSLEESRPSPTSDSAPEECAKRPDPESMTVTELAASIFIDDELQDAVPTGFSVDHIVRNGPEETNHDYATVGVQMESPVAYARVIFFVHPDQAAARSMYEHELQMTESRFADARRSEGFRGWRPYAPENTLPGTRCGAGTDDLLVCHAVRGRVVMLTQSSAGGAQLGGKVSETQLKAAETLARSFGSYLREVYRTPDGEQVPAFGRYRFTSAGGFNRDGSPAEATGIIEVNSDDGTVCLMSQILGATEAHLHPDAAGESITLFEPPRPYRSTLCSRGLPAKALEAIIADPTSYSIEFHNEEAGGTLSSQLELMSTPPAPEDDEAAACRDAPRPTSDRRGSFVFYPPSAQQEGGNEVLPVVFPDGSSAELVYPVSLQLDELYAAPFLVGGSKKDGMMRPRISYGGVSFRVEGPIDCLRGPKGEQVPVWRAENQEVIVLRFGQWHVSVFGRNTDLALWAENLRGNVEEGGWLTLAGENGLLLGPQFQPGDSELLLADRRNILTVRPLDCSSRRYRDEASETSVSFCADNAQITAQGTRDFVEGVGEGVSVRNLETVHPLKDYVVIP